MIMTYRNESLTYGSKDNVSVSWTKAGFESVFGSFGLKAMGLDCGDEILWALTLNLAADPMTFEFTTTASSTLERFSL
jgi:hypothetical protein